MSNEYIVYLILKPDAENELMEIAFKEHCWYNRSPHNEDIMKKLLDDGKLYDNDKLITMFKIEDSIEEELYALVDEIMDHHNEYSDPPGLGTLFVIGIDPKEEIAGYWLMEYLRNEYDFSYFEKTKDGFKAIRPQELRPRGVDR